MNIAKEHTIVCKNAGCETEGNTPPAGECVAAKGIHVARGKIAPGVHIHINCDVCPAGHIVWGQNEAPGVAAH